jgi:hypothetical protein
MSRSIAAAVFAAAAVLATGCLSVPPYKPEVSVSYTETGTGGTAAGPGFALHFADGAGFHFPDALTIDGVDVMGHDTTSACFDQDEVGFQISPTPRISAHGSAPPVTNRLVPVLRGPAVVQLKLDWATQFACNLNRTPGGTATFTVFPDGRIVRYDTIVDPITTSISPTPCSCGAEGLQFNVVTFWTFAGASFHALYAPNETMLPLPMDTLVSNYETSCVADPAHQVALAWRKSKDTEISSSGALIRFGHTLSDVGVPMLAAFTFDNSSAIFIEHAAEAAGCTAATIRAAEHVRPSPLSIGGVPTMPSERDGIYGGDVGSDGTPGIVLTTDRVELIGPVKSSFAVRLRFPHAVDALRATLESASGPWYLPQRVDDRSWIIWFRDPISAGQTITVESI